MVSSPQTAETLGGALGKAPLRWPQQGCRPSLALTAATWASAGGLLAGLLLPSLGERSHVGRERGGMLE